MTKHDSLLRKPSPGRRPVAHGLRSWVARFLDRTRARMSTEAVYLDTETTGLFGDVRIVEVAIVDDAGTVLINTLVNPQIRIPADATAIHGIDDSDVAAMPTIHDLMVHVDDAIRDRPVVIYNASYDQRLFPGQLHAARSVLCAMRRFKLLPFAVGNGNGTLAKAASWAGHAWTGTAHRALADALAARTVWQHLDRQGVPMAAGRRVGGWRRS